MTLSYETKERLRLLGSLKEFIESFYFIRNGRPFNSPDVSARESHVDTVCRELLKLHRLETMNLLLNLPPGHGKSTFLVYLCAFAYAHNHDCQNIYISYSSELAETHTAEIKAIMSLPIYRKIFGVYIDPTSSARGDFRICHETLPGQGRTVARGSGSGITGINAGLQDARSIDGKPRFSGLVIMDDLHKPDEVHSDTRRENVINNYNQTIKMRRRGNHVGMVLLGQRLHEDDICQFMIDGKDGQKWSHVILQSLDGAENALAPHIVSKENLLIERKFNEYAFYSQHMQTPLPAGGGIFKKDCFKLLPEEPDCFMTFLTIDSAESEKEYADYTAFSFWGMYQIQINNTDVKGLYGLHCISAMQIRIEPKDLRDEFLQFYTECLRYKCAPNCAAIEKKSSGTGLISTLKEVPGIRVINIERGGNSKSKADRFLECQEYVARGLVSLPSKGKHTEMFINHMAKITANNSHRWDDLADTMADAIRIAIIEKQFTRSRDSENYDLIAQEYKRAQDSQLRFSNTL